MAYHYETRNLASGWQCVEYIGCDVDENGNANIATAEKIVKWWGVTENDAMAHLRVQAIISFNQRQGA